MTTSLGTPDVFSPSQSGSSNTRSVTTNLLQTIMSTTQLHELSVFVLQIFSLLHNRPLSSSKCVLVGRRARARECHTSFGLCDPGVVENRVVLQYVSTGVVRGARRPGSPITPFSSTFVDENEPRNTLSELLSRGLDVNVRNTWNFC